MKAIKLAQVPAPSVQISDTVKHALPVMGNDAGCGIAVMDGNQLVGTISKEDVMVRVVAAGLDPGATIVKDVMTSPPAKTITPDIDADEALRLMFSHRQCYLPIVDDQQKLRGWLSICHLFRNHVDDLKNELDSLASYIAADGPGG
jgi:CBS domain-containing protein